ncbi:hypothetical protein MMC11_004763 [Xylographa trunciseda]|nr:hypothetical protein [Xylographa trunciseda]
MERPMDNDGDGLSSKSPPDDVEVALVGGVDITGASVAGNSGSLSDDEASRLRSLAAEVVDQDELERNIGRQADQLLTGQANERDEKRLEKTQTDKAKLAAQIRKIQSRLSQPTGSATTIRLKAEIANYEAQIDRLDTDAKEIRERINERQQDLEQDDQNEQTGNRKMPNESQRDYLIRTGKITPFSKMPGLPRTGSTLQDVLLYAEEDEPEDVPEETPISTEGPISHRDLLQPGFADEATSETLSDSPDTSDRPTKRRRLLKESGIFSDDSASTTTSQKQREGLSGVTRELSEDYTTSSFEPGMDDHDSAHLGESSDEKLASGDDDFVMDTPASKQKRADKRGKTIREEPQKEDLAGLDDGNEKLYQARLRSWVARRSNARKRAKARRQSESEGLDGTVTWTQDREERKGVSEEHYTDEGDKEWHLPHPTIDDTEFEGGYKIPGDIYPSLFDYQKTGVRWLWELYSQQVGGIIGDEMGLGKTIQAIAFLAGLHYSKKITKPIIVVAPATVMKQWVNEFHTWWPPFRVSILHTSGSGMIDIRRESQREEELSAQLFDASRHKPLSKSQKAAKRIVDRVVQEGHVLVTTYSGLQTYAELLIPIDWEYAVLDEGHKIRNPNTAITIYCKELRTANRIILSGTPMQNNLVELWSLFDFVFPMRLGTLVNFRQQFEIPIRQGGYANASNLQVQTASKCAEMLKDTISPYLLQRIKVDVAADLPKKTEQVLFCKLTRPQREAYENFLGSDDMSSILNGKRQVLYGVDILRKICNHPDLQEHRVLSVKAGYNYGTPAKSGKMIIVKELLDVWKRGGHKTLLFAQHRIMLDILEKYIKSMDDINYRRMDGNTPISVRQAMVDEFNTNPEAHVFLLTTKVGGLGINLTGADRVIIYDPDWNPSTDIQARERAWRLGQKREVQIYRLMVAGTIEEKIFHRQIFKQFLTNKILRDPKQRQTFQLKDLHDLFSLGRADEEATETGRLFEGAEVKFGNGVNKFSTSAPIDTTPWGGEVASEHINDDQAVRGFAGVASIESIDGKDELTNPDHMSVDAVNSEARIMEGIFARSGVHSALEHDQIINGKKVITADPKIIEREARKVASEAAIELKKAEQIARNVPVGTPTWTGQFGTAGRPEQQHMRGSGRGGGRGGPSSTSILAGLQNQQAANASAYTQNRNNLPAQMNGQNGPRATSFIKLIRDYMITHGGKVHTQMLIDHFNRHCNTPEKTAEFKAMLKEIATLQKGSRGRGAWLLKEDYRAPVYSLLVFEEQAIRPGKAISSLALIVLTNMRTFIIASFLLYTSLTSAWPWPPSIRNIGHPVQRRQNNVQSNPSSTSATLSPAETSLVFDSFAPSPSTSNNALSNSISITGSAEPSAAASTMMNSGSNSEGPTKTGSLAGKQTGNKTSKAPETTSIDPRLPAGGIEMLTPAAIAPASYYKIGDQITFGWNYTSLIVTPTAIDILATCSGCASAYTLSNNASVKETGSVVWDTSGYATGTNPLLTESYTLIIHDAAQPTTAAAQAGYLGIYNSFTFGMYAPQPYTGLDNFVCATCSGALSNMERQTLTFLFGMGMITIMSFTWFAGGFGVFGVF